MLTNVVDLLSTLNPYDLTIHIADDPNYVELTSPQLWERGTSRWTNLSSVHCVEGSTLFVGKKSNNLSVLSPTVLANSPFERLLKIEWDLCYGWTRIQSALGMLLETRAFESDAIRNAGGYVLVFEDEDEVNDCLKILDGLGLADDVRALIEIQVAGSNHRTRWSVARLPFSFPVESSQG